MMLWPKLNLINFFLMAELKCVSCIKILLYSLTILACLQHSSWLRHITSR
uniref:Uncharacterized protein n=1 Tax=Arundo donax TaxID=35708 RepID=A0A0A8YF66_ARUDO